MAKKEYIERKALFNYPIRRDYYDTQNGNIDFISGIKSVFEYAEHLPIADVQEVKHGKWIYVDGVLDWADYKCSNCGYIQKFEDDTCFYNYCPTCGAKMDKR